MIAARAITQVLRQGTRIGQNIHTSSRRAISHDKVKAAQEKFQIDDGLPVWRKGGAVDHILFGLVSVLCVVGVGSSLQTIYELSFPAKKE